MKLSTTTTEFCCRHAVRQTGGLLKTTRSHGIYTQKIKIKNLWFQYSGGAELTHFCNRQGICGKNEIGEAHQGALKTVLGLMIPWCAHGDFGCYGRECYCSLTLLHCSAWWILVVEKKKLISIRLVPCLQWVSDLQKHLQLCVKRSISFCFFCFFFLRSSK